MLPLSHGLGDVAQFGVSINNELTPSQPAEKESYDHAS